MYWNDGPRTWKYAVPGAVCILLIPVTGKMMVSPNADVQFLAMLPLMFAVLSGGIALMNWWRLFTSHLAELFDSRQRALSVTPLVLLSENMKSMHPEAVRVLNRFGVRTSWQVRVDANRGQRDWVLADTNVHFGFIEYVLSKSGTALYPKNRFSEGSKKWDPDGLVEDREQYDELEKWMYARLMVTRSFGEYKAAEFIPPWTPDLILETMGLTGEQDLYQPDDMKVKELDQKINGQKVMPVKAVAEKVIDVQALTEDEIAAINRENAEYSAKYK